MSASPNRVEASPLHRPTTLLRTPRPMLALAGLLCLAEGCRAKPPPPAPPDRAVLRSIMARHRVLGLSYLTTAGGDVLYEGYLGHRDCSRSLPTTPNTAYRIASISKPITATAVMQQVEARRMGLDDNIEKLVGFRVRNPHFPKIPVRVWHLLTHTSGLSDEGRYVRFREDSYSGSAPPLRAFFEPTKRYTHRDNWIGHPPGTAFEYSNLAFGLLATAVERVTRERFPDYVRRRIFAPLSMGADFAPERLARSRSLATLCMPSRKGFRATMDAPADKRSYKRAPGRHRRAARRNPSPGYNAMIHAPQGGVRASARDLSRFLLATLGRGAVANGPAGGARILREETVRQMLAMGWQGTRANGYYHRSGLGWNIVDTLEPGRRWIGHGGRAYGFLGMLYFDRIGNKGVILLMNGGDFYRHEPEEVEYHDVLRELFTAIRTPSG